MVFLNVEQYAMISNCSLVNCCPITTLKLCLHVQNQIFWNKSLELNKENNRKHESIKEMMNEVTEGQICLKKFDMTVQIMQVFLM